MSSTSTPGLCNRRLNLAEYAQNFADAHPPLNQVQAKIEADRCYYCFDAPCQTACPTGIDIPTFIARIAQGNLRGAARTILEENILGGMCARVCPTEVLCEQACVRNSNEAKPVEIGLLQRHATDAYMANPGAPLFTRAPSSGRKVVVVGAGPAGLSCAHRLAMLGHDVVLLDNRPKAGGLNEYGLATYKTVDNFAQREIDWLLSIGGIELRLNVALGPDLTLDALCQQYDAVFLGDGRQRARADRAVLARRARRGGIHRRAAPGGAPFRGGDRSQRGGDWRRHDGDRCLGAEPSARCAAGHDAVPARARGDGRVE